MKRHIGSISTSLEEGRPCPSSNSTNIWVSSTKTEDPVTQGPFPCGCTVNVLRGSCGTFS